MTEERASRKWIGRGAWAVVDQGLFALANVLLNLLLARWLAPSEYGAFAVGYSLFLFIGSFHTALLTEPLLVFGPGKYRNQPRKYLSILVRGHWAITGTGSLLLAVAGFALTFSNHTRPLAGAMFGLALAAPFSLLMWFSRRAAYVQVQPRLAAIASAAYLVLLCTGLLTLQRLHIVSIFSAMVTLGVVGAVTGLALLHWVRRAITDAEDQSPMPIVTDHWRYGRWASATSVLMWVPLNFFFVVLSALVNLEASATLKALSNLVLPMLQANAALSSLLLPAMVSRAHNREQLTTLLRSSMLLLAAGAGAYLLVIGAFSAPLVHLFYGGRYDSQSNLLWLLLLIPLLDGAMVVCASALRSLERPDRVFWAQLAVAFFVLTIGVVATRQAGLWGATASIVSADLVGTIILGAGVLAQLQRHSVRQTSFVVPHRTEPPQTEPQTEVCQSFS